jgi:hypothetical protein
MSVRLSTWLDFMKFDDYFSKIEKVQVSLTLDKNNGYVVDWGRGYGATTPSHLGL